MYLGVPSLGVGINRVETDYTWSSPGTHAVEFAYDKGNSKLTAEVDGTTLEWIGITITADSYGESVMLIKIAHRHVSCSLLSAPAFKVCRSPIIHSCTSKPQVDPELSYGVAEK